MAGLADLVRRPFQQSQNTVEISEVRPGESELARLEHAPADSARAQALSTALAARAAADPDFQADLQRWHEQVKLVRTGDGDVRNEISGGTFNGPALQGRDFSGVSFTTPSPTTPSSPPVQD
jgi:hypothetical protein